MKKLLLYFIVVYGVFTHAMRNPPPQRKRVLYSSHVRVLEKGRGNRAISILATSLIQPMDQGVLQYLKKYLRRLLQSLLESTEGEETIVDALKKNYRERRCVLGGWCMGPTSDTLLKS